MCTTATLTHAAEMTLLADNGCCATTFPYCSDGHALTWRKARLGYKFSMPTMFKVFLLQFSFISFLVFILHRLIYTLSFRKNGIFDDVTIKLTTLSEK